MAQATNRIVYEVRLADGASQSYEIVAPENVAPLPLNPRSWTTPSMATDNISAREAVLVAVAWAGGITKSAKTGPPNSMVDIGGSTPGGFYGASFVWPVSVELRNGPVPFYLVQMTGQIGSTRQTLYAAVLKDSRIIKPLPVSATPSTKHQKGRHRV
jgi:hypothetical protein